MKPDVWTSELDSENPVGNTFAILYDGAPALYVDAWAYLTDGDRKSDEARIAALEMARGACRRLLVLLNENRESVFPHEDDECCHEDDDDE